jgi:hypothetical protein
MNAALRVLTSVFLGVAVIVVTTGDASAQGLAVRSGANINPDQWSVGGQYEHGPVFDRLWLQPNADLGVGNDATLVAMNFDVVYRKPIARRATWTAYAGGGPALNWFKLVGYNQTGLGANLVGGVRHSNGLFTEMRAGFLDSPELRIGVGYTFGQNGAANRRQPASRRR